MDIFNVYLPITGGQFNILLLLSIGFCVGVLGGFFGIGGAWIVTPALNIFGFPMPYAIGTDFAHILGKSIIATRKHARMGNVDWKLGLTTMIGTIPGVESGAQLVMFLEKLGKSSGEDIVGIYVRWTYIILLLILAVYMFYDYFVILPRIKSQQTDKGNIPLFTNRKTFKERLTGLRMPPMISYPKSGIESFSVWIILIVFFLCGFISGFLGVGGGFIRMPALIYLIGCPTAIAIGTDLFIVMLDGGYGCFTYALKGRVEVFAAMIMLIGAAVGAQIGVTAVRYIHGYGIRLLFGIMILFAALCVLLKQIEAVTGLKYLNDLSATIIMGSSFILCLIIIVKLVIAEREAKKLKILN
jgi:uncharacterized membrane protein YfcA